MRPAGLDLGHGGLHRVLVGGGLGSGAGAVLELRQHSLPLLGGLHEGTQGEGDQQGVGRQVLGEAVVRLCSRRCADHRWHSTATCPSRRSHPVQLVQPPLCGWPPPQCRTWAQDRSCAMQRSRMALKAGEPYTSDARRMVWATASAEGGRWRWRGEAG